MLPKSEIARLRGLARHRRARREAGRFLVEGTKLVAEVLASPLEVTALYVEAGCEELLQPLASSAVAQQAISVPRHQLERIASTASPQPVVAEAVIAHAALDVLDRSNPLLVAVDVNDPGNLGTLTRTVEATGFGALCVVGATTDSWGPKAIRAAAGASFRVPVIDGGDTASFLARLSSLGYELIGTRMRDADDCDEVDMTGHVALLLGSEAHGLDSGGAAVDTWVSVPMAGKVESLNVAMTGAILAYEVARQRRR